jgi:hypothetical protein
MNKVVIAFCEGLGLPDPLALLDERADLDPYCFIPKTAARFGFTELAEAYRTFQIKEYLPGCIADLRRGLAGAWKTQGWTALLHVLAIARAVRLEVPPAGDGELVATAVCLAKIAVDILPNPPVDALFAVWHEEDVLPVETARQAAQALRARGPDVARQARVRLEEALAFDYGVVRASRGMRTDLPARIARRIQRLGKRAKEIGDEAEDRLHALAGRLLGCGCDNYWNWMCHAGRRDGPKGRYSRNCACVCHPSNRYDGPDQYDPPERVLEAGDARTSKAEILADQPPALRPLTAEQRATVYRLFTVNWTIRDWTRPGFDELRRRS